MKSLWGAKPPPARTLADPISKPPMFGSASAMVSNIVPKRTPVKHEPGSQSPISLSPAQPGLYFPPTRIHDDFMKMDSAVFGKGTPQPPFQGTLGDGTPMTTDALSSIQINFDVYVFAASLGARIFAWIGDDVTSLATTEVALSPLSTKSSSITFDSWPNPFPEQLYGNHKLWIELWEVSSEGAPLPASYQAVANDPRLFRNVSSDWSWVFVSAGCKEDGTGPDFLTINEMAFSNTAIELDSSGTKIAAGQSALLSWNILSANLPATAFNYAGSFVGINVVYNVPNWTPIIWHIPAENMGSYSIDLGGLAWNMQAGITPYLTASVVSGAKCGEKTVFSANVAVTNALPPTQTLPDLLVHDIYVIIPPDNDVGIPEPNEAFSIVYIIANIGGAAAGPFTVTAQIDPDNVPFPYTFENGLAANTTGAFQLNFSAGLDFGEYVTTCIIDPSGQIMESNENNNTSYYTVTVSG